MFLTKEQILAGNHTYKRIVSVVPSQTELLFNLGLDKEVIGITKFCIHPQKQFHAKKRIGGTKDLKIEEIRLIKPDLIIANKEENQQDQIELLAAEFPVYLSDIYSLEDAFEMMTCVGKLTSRVQEANRVVTQIRAELDAFVPDLINRKVLYLIWRKPYMASGTNTFINTLLNFCGWENALPASQTGKDFSRYPELSENEIAQISPEVILLSSEPYPFGIKHIEELQLLCPNAIILLGDGELFSWYGSRLRFSVSHFNAVLERLRYFHPV